MKRALDVKRPSDRRQARLARIGPWVAGGAVLLGACNAITGLSDDYHLEADGGGTTPVPESSTPDTSTPDTGTPDAPEADVVGPDGAMICDGGVDANPEAGLVFCNDFEDVDPGATYYRADAAGPNGFQDGAITTEPGQGVASTRGLVVALTKGATTSSHLWYAFTLPQTAPPQDFTHYEVSFQIKVQGTTAIQYITMGILTFTADVSGNGDFGTALYSQPSPTLHRINDPGGNAVATTDNRWHRVRITFDKIGVGPTFKRALAIDDTEIGADESYAPPMTGTAELRLGAFYTGPQAGAITAQFDQLVVYRRK